MNIKVEVQNKGKMIGTCGWVKSQLENSKLIIKPCNDGLAGIFLQKNNETKGQLIAFVAKEEEKADLCHSYEEFYSNIFAIRPIEDMYVNGFSPTLTDSAKDIVEDFISQSVNALSNFLNSDKAEFEIKVEDIN